MEEALVPDKIDFPKPKKSDFKEGDDYSRIDKKYSNMAKVVIFVLVAIFLSTIVF